MVLRLSLSHLVKKMYMSLIRNRAVSICEVEVYLKDLAAEIELDVVIIRALFL